MSKQAGRMSQSTNDFLTPYAPTIGTATDVGTSRPYNNGAITVTFTPTGPNAATSYTASAYCSEHGTIHTATGPSSPLTITGFGSGVVTTVTVKGTNSYGTGPSSSASNSVTVTTVPQSPVFISVANTCSDRGFNNGLVVVGVEPRATGGKSITSHYAISNAGQSASSASSSINITGLSGGTSYTFQGRVSNANGDSSLTSASGAVTATTVPGQITDVSASTPSAGVDRITWSAPANGGSGITNYYWSSTDGKSGSTQATTVDINQEQGTAQTYTVRADNACGAGLTSPASNSVTTTFSFVPFGVFSFSPFGVFSFSPFGVFSFSPFGVFSFSPFGFSPFSPGGFGFTPQFQRSLAPITKVRMADGTMKEAQDVYVGDVLMSVELPGFANSYTTEELLAWVATQDITELPLTTTTVKSVVTHPSSGIVSVNEDVFSPNHIILIKRGEEISMKKVFELDVSDLVWDYTTSGWAPITILEAHEYEHSVITINCEPNDLFFTHGALTHDGNEWLYPQPGDN